MVLEANTLIRGKYRVTRLIGDGGMGAVYEAEHLILKLPVALKFLHNELAERQGLAERFLREARVSATIQNPHVTRVTDVDTTDSGTPFLVMELLRGQSLQSLLDREQRLPIETSIDYALQILYGLEAAHALNVVHRDLKPDNIFITDSPGGPLLKLIDFGIAKLRDSEEYKQTLTRAGAMMGTPEYMAPEQLYSAESVDARADIFSLGVILYEMLSGKRPVTGDDATEIVGQFVSGNVVRLKQRIPDVSDELERIVHRALEVQREARFDTAFQMRMQLGPLGSRLSQAGQAAASAAAQPSTPPLAPDPEDRGTPSERGVPDTLPPGPGTTTEDDPSLPERGGTEEAPALGARARSHASALAPPPSRAAAEAGAAFKVRAAALPITPLHASKRPNKLLITILILLLVAIAAAMAILVLQRRDTNGSSAGLELGTEAAPTTVEAEVPNAPDAGPDVSPTPGPATRPPTAVPGARPTRPAPSSGSASEGPPAFPFPSALPPFPSSLPPLPSGFPTAIPSFLPPIPGFSPPGAPAPVQDAGAN